MRTVLKCKDIQHPGPRRGWVYLQVEVEDVHLVHVLQALTDLSDEAHRLQLHQGVVHVDDPVEQLAPINTVAAQTHRQTDARTHRRIYAQTHRQRVACTQRRTDTSKHRRTNTCTHRYTQTQTHAHTHTDTRTQVNMRTRSSHA